MYNVNLENQLIIVNIVDALIDHTSIQIDIDSTKIKAAELVAQNLDLKKVISQTNLNRCIDPQNEADEALKTLIISPLCYYTYARCLKMFQGTFTDSGFMIEGDAENRYTAKSVSNEMKSIGDAMMEPVIDFLDVESPNDESVDEAKITSRVRTFGGNETRASN